MLGGIVQVAVLVLLGAAVKQGALAAENLVSLADVTGTSARPLLAALTPPPSDTVSELGYNEGGAALPPRPPHHRPGQGGLVSLEDVTGQRPLHPPHPHPHQPPPPPPHPLRPPHQGQYSPCTPSYYYLQQEQQMQQLVPPPADPAVNYVSLSDVQGPSQGASRSRRSPGEVRLEDVAGPVAARYPAFGPPAYVRPLRPAYGYGGYGYGYNRPYYNRPYYGYMPPPLACIGLFCL